MDNELLNQYRNINWDRLLMNRLGEAGSLNEAKPWFDRVKAFLDKLLSEEVISVLPPRVIAEIEGNVRGFINFIEQNILLYSDVSQRSEKVRMIKDQIGEVLSVLGKHSIYFDVLPGQSSASLSFEKHARDITEAREKEIRELQDIKDNINKLSPGLQQASEVANKITARKDQINDALVKVEEFIKTNEKAVETLLQRNATSFAQKAQEHISYTQERVPIWILKRVSFLNLNRVRQPAWYIGSIIWLWSGIFLGLVVFGIITYFIFHGGFSWEEMLLRFSALAIPSYFAIFFINQFLFQRKLYEAYKFKDIALQTMIMLKTQFVNDHSAQQELLQRSLAVIFSEPALKEETKYDKNFILELLRMLREK